MRNFGATLAALWACYCVFVYDWRLGVAWFIVGLVSAS